MSDKLGPADSPAANRTIPYMSYVHRPTAPGNAHTLGYILGLTLLLLIVTRFSSGKCATFSDANWVSLSGLPGAGGGSPFSTVTAVLANTNAGLMYIGGRFTVVGTNLANNIAAWNGTTWSALGVGLTNIPGFAFPVTALVLDGAGNLYAGGSFNYAGGLPAANIAKWDGTNWWPLGSGLNGSVLALALDSSGNLYAGGTFTMSGLASVPYIARWDGNTWTTIDSGMNAAVNALTMDGSGNLYAGGTFTTAGSASALRVAKWNGSSWSPLGPGFNSTVYAISTDTSGNVFSGGTFNASGTNKIKGVAMWNGIEWSPLGSGLGGSSDSIRTFHFDNAGNLYAAGSFLTNGGVRCGDIAKWNGSSWSAVGSGFIQSATTVYGIAFDNAGNLFAGGTINQMGFAPGDYIVKWDGNSWSAVQSFPRITKEVHALQCDKQGNVYAAGLSVPAKWNGTNWVSLAAGMGIAGGTPKILAIALDEQTNLYAGGVFGSIDGVTAYNLAKWNGAGWSSLDFDLSGPGQQNYVNALAVDNKGNLYEGSGDVQIWNGTNWSILGATGTIYALALDELGNLYVGGYVNAGPVSNDHVAKWDGNGWSPLGSGLNNYVYSLVVDKIGNIYAGGEFTFAGSVSINHVAKWDGNAWSPLGNGLTDAVIKLTLDPFGNLYAVGRFQSSASISVNRIAKWDGVSWSPLGSGLNAITYAVAQDGAGHLYAGGAFTTAGTNYSAYVTQANLPDSIGLINITKAPNGVSMALQGRPDTTCVFQSSTNLADWSPVSTNVCGTNGLWSLTNSATVPTEFFRAVLP